MNLIEVDKQCLEVGKTYLYKYFDKYYLCNIAFVFDEKWADFWDQSGILPIDRMDDSWYEEVGVKTL